MPGGAERPVDPVVRTNAAARDPTFHSYYPDNLQAPEQAGLGEPELRSD